MSDNVRVIIHNTLDFIADTWLPFGVLALCFAAWLIGPT